MPLKISPELKKITQYIRRAEELDRDTTPQTRLVAYYCRQHAVQVGIPFSTTPAARECLGQILNDLEKEKKAMSNFTKEEGYVICREFAMKVFDKADSIDRAGKSNKSTAKSFYAAASFLDVLTHFHGNEQLPDELKSDEVIEEEKKSFYAKWKATDILKAIREGREIVPGGFGETLEAGEEAAQKEEEDIAFPPPPPADDDDDAEQGTEVAADGNILPPPPAYPGMADIQPPTAPSFRAPKPVPAPAPAPSSGGFMGGFFGGGNSGGKGKYSKAVLGDAKELTRFALAALNDKDGDLAIERLQQALETLTQA
jgi:vacuolar protein sorting-associated protein VTA1